MVCSICDQAPGDCENCAQEIGDEFYCFNEAHFCSRKCWKEWLIDEAENHLEDALLKEGE